MVQYPNPTLTSNTTIPPNVLKLSGPLARTGNILLWVGETIILISRTNQKMKLRAAEIKLTAGAILIIAAIIEGQEAKSYTGVLPKENPSKVIGSVISEIGAIILTLILFYEISLAGASSQEPTISPVLSD
ncbi:MAG: hypothetical protein APF84_12615 [Gracilibacter sp. BRH_c7a]|nr:MAG: hypothetical protein APF84_12615 [Gracilibacter sp. BRH_c7a]